MKCDENDGELPGKPASTHNSNRTDMQHVEQDNDWLTALEHEMEEIAKKWPGSGHAY